MDRLIIDLSHVFRSQSSELDAKTKKSENDRFQQRIASFSLALLKQAAMLSTFGFSSIRAIAKRLKRPLWDVLPGHIVEAKELGLRLRPDQHHDCSDEKLTSYSDWQPIVDVSIANSISGAGEPGSRCAFIGYEENHPHTTSLNVEEYALEMYASGRLPADEQSQLGQGGWAGWHNEGSHLRALFRIMCSAPILDAGYGCVSSQQENLDQLLSPYQEAPFDLHVGFELCDEGETSKATPGIYYRRSSTIHSFLELLEGCNPSDVADLVYDAVRSRLDFAHANAMKDPTLEKDFAQIRTLSALAAGFGGKVLARAFRCMLYDYRHYRYVIDLFGAFTTKLQCPFSFSGGLPDLQLVRAIKQSGEGHDVVNMEWVGECFSKEAKEHVASQRLASILFDKDDEYLGCSKVGDRHSNRQHKPPQNNVNPQGSQRALPMVSALPPRVEFSQDGKAVEIQSMFVEVKSSNDRLDPRQEDWLNVLSIDGLARVCKFQENRKQRRVKKQKV